MSIEPTQAISTVTAEKVGLAIAAPARPSIVSVHAGTGELLRITPTGEVIAPSLEAASEAGRVFVDSIRHHLQPSTPASGEVVAWMYRWKVDGEYVNWRYSDASNYHKSLDGYEETPLYKHAAPVHPAADLVELKAEIARLRKMLVPQWYYADGYSSEDCHNSPDEVIEYLDNKPGTHVVQIDCAGPMPSIWCAVRVRSESEMDAEETDNRVEFTEHATEDEARAALSRYAGGA